MKNNGRCWGEKAAYLKIIFKSVLELIHKNMPELIKLPSTPLTLFSVYEDDEFYDCEY